MISAHFNRCKRKRPVTKSGGLKKRLKLFGPSRSFAEPSTSSGDTSFDFRNEKRATTPSLDEEKVLMMNSTLVKQKVSCSDSVKNFIREDCLREIEQHGGRCTLDAIATALKSSKRLLNFHEASEATHFDLTSSSPIESLSYQLSRFSLYKRQNGLERALAQLERDPASYDKQISSWEEALQGLETVITFRPPIEKKESPKNMSFADYGALLTRQFQAFRNRESFRFRPSAATFSQIWHSSRKSEVTKETEELGKSPLETAEELATKALEEAYEEADKPSVVVQQVGERLDQKEAEEARAEADEEPEEEDAEAMAASLLRALTDAEQQIVRNAIYGLGPPNEILAKIGTDTVQRESLHRLRPGQWLNDEVIHYFYVMLAKRDEELCKQDPSRTRSHFFKSFFMTKLLQEGDADPAKDGNYCYRNVKRWSKKAPGKDLFALDKVFFPINQNNCHWVCVCAHIQEKRVELYDSMGSRDDRYINHVFQYLQDEHMDKKKKPLPDIDEWTLATTQPSTPRQQNGFDCGVFTCMFADFVSQDRPLVFSQEHITQCRERIALSIMNGVAIL